MIIYCLNRLAIGALLLSATTPAIAQSSIQVNIENVRSETGTLMISLCTQEQYGKFSQCENAAVPASPEVQYVFENVANGQYGISVYHDKNDNGKMDFRFYGPPKEAYGSSNNPRPRFGPPKFSDIAFDVEDAFVELVIRMRGNR